MARLKRTTLQLSDLADPHRGLPVQFSLFADLADPAGTLLALRTLAAFDRATTRYPVQRTLRLAVRRSLDDLLDVMALHSGLDAQRLDSTSLLLDGTGVFVRIGGRRKADYSSLTVNIWAESIGLLNETRANLQRIAGEQLMHGPMFTIDWHFVSGHAGLASATFDEPADPPPFDESYPTLGEPVATFIDRYLASPETVLILQGPPGTGKTRLVRAILAAMSARKGDNANVLYTADRRALDSDELFVEFITGSHDAFVVEDADHLLAARADGNADMHRFLAVADGVVRAQGRKIIFTTNLPNVGDIDAALVRPGRCFAIVRTRALTPCEATAVAGRIRFAAARPYDPRGIRSRAACGPRDHVAQDGPDYARRHGFGRRVVRRAGVRASRRVP